jgi:hypothetical protein
MGFKGSSRKVMTAQLVLRGGTPAEETLAGARTLTFKDGQFLKLDPGGASRNVSLPAFDDGLMFYIVNIADAPGENLVVKNAAGTTIATVAPNRAAWFWSEGSEWLTGGTGPATSSAPDGFLTFRQQTIDMADAQVKLVYGTAGAGEAQITGQLLLVDANSGTTEDLLLPAEANSFGVVLFICNTGGEDIVVKEDSDTTTICTISTAESAFVACDGTTWRGGVVKAT